MIMRGLCVCCPTNRPAARFASGLDRRQLLKLGKNGIPQVLAILLVPADQASCHFAVWTEEDHLRHAMVMTVRVVGNELIGNEANRIIDLQNLA